VARRRAVVLGGGREFDADVVAWDPGRDLATPTIEADGLPAADVHDCVAPRVGELVFAVLDPLGRIMI
jgi:S1-C subfamily serine protease